MSEKNLSYLTTSVKRSVKCDNCLLIKCDNCDGLGVGEDPLT